MSEEKLNQQEIVKLAAEAGAKAAMETLEKERQRDRREMADRRLRNTKLLLRNYRVFCAHVDNASMRSRSASRWKKSWPI